MIETKNLTKTFDNFTAVDSLNLKIEKGEFFWSSRTKRSRQDNDHQSALNPSSSDKGRNPHRWSAAYEKAPGPEKKNQCDHSGVFHAPGYEYG